MVLAGSVNAAHVEHCCVTVTQERCDQVSCVNGSSVGHVQSSVVVSVVVLVVVISAAQ